jgi:hypothetical protein
MIPFFDPGHRPQIKWIPTLVPIWCTGDVYPSSNLIPSDDDPRPSTPFLDPADPDFWQLWSFFPLEIISDRVDLRLSLVIMSYASRTSADLSLKWFCGCNCSATHSKLVAQQEAWDFYDYVSNDQLQGL